MTTTNNDRMICPECGRDVKRSYYKTHCKTKVHLNSIKSGVKHSTNADRTGYYRDRYQTSKQKLIDSKGIEFVREKNRLAKRVSRARLKGSGQSARGLLPKSKDVYEKHLSMLNKKNNGGLTEQQVEQKIAKLKKPVPLGTLREIKFRSLKKPLKDISNLYSFMTGKAFDCTDYSWVKDTQKVFDFVMGRAKWKSMGSKSVQFQSLASILRNFPKYRKQWKFYSKAGIDLNLKREKREKNNSLENDLKAIQKSLTWPEFLKVDRIMKKRKAPLILQALNALYTLIPPRRLEYNQMRVFRKRKGKSNKRTKKFNYLILDRRDNPKSIELNNFKTSDMYGQYVVELPKKLSEILGRYLKQSGLVQNGSYVFPNENGGALDKSNFSKMITSMYHQYTGIPAGLNELRHAFVSNYLSVFRSEKQIDMKAFELGNSANIWRSTYLKKELTTAFKKDLDDLRKKHGVKINL